MFSKDYISGSSMVRLCQNIFRCLALFNCFTGKFKSLLTGYFSCFWSSADFSPDFFKINSFEKFFQEYHQSVKQFGSRLAQHFVGTDLVPNCLKVISR